MSASRRRSRGARASSCRRSDARPAARRPVLHPGTFHAAELRRAARPRAVHHQRTHRARRSSAPSCCDVLRVLKGGKSLADSLATHPDYFSDLYVNMVRAGEASGSLAAIFERLAEFERSRDELRSYIISSMIYPALLALVGLASIFVLLNFVVPRFAQHLQDSRMKIPLPTQIMLEASHIVQDYWWMAVAVASPARWSCFARLHPHRRRAGSGGTASA